MKQFLHFFRKKSQPLGVGWSKPSVRCAQLEIRKRYHNPARIVGDTTQTRKTTQDRFHLSSSSNLVWRIGTTSQHQRIRFAALQVIGSRKAFSQSCFCVGHHRANARLATKPGTTVKRIRSQVLAVSCDIGHPMVTFGLHFTRSPHGVNGRDLRY